MSALQISPKKTANTKNIILVIIVLGIGLIGLPGYMWWQSATVNYAQEAARPIEEALVKAGAVKVCSRGDDGRGSDNRQPWYRAYFESTMDSKRAKNLIMDVAKENNLNLKEAPAGTKGYLGDTVYTGTVSNSGRTADLAVAVTNSAPLKACAPKSIPDDDQNTAFSIELSLPSK